MPGAHRAEHVGTGEAAGGDRPGAWGLAFEDYREGMTFETGAACLEIDDLLDFAQRFDPQPFHGVASSAAPVNCNTESTFGGTIASGWHTIALSWRLWVDTGHSGDRGRGGVAMENCRWLRPVRPGDEMRAHVRVGETRLTRKEHGLVRLDFSIVNQNQLEVARFSTFSLIERRAGGTVGSGT